MAIERTGALLEHMPDDDPEELYTLPGERALMRIADSLEQIVQFMHDGRESRDPDHNPDDLLRLAEVARIVGATRETVKRWADEADVELIRRGRATLIRYRDIKRIQGRRRLKSGLRKTAVTDEFT